MMSQVEVIVSPQLKQATPLRKHLDLAKYIDLLSTKSFYFRRADSFSDRFEGAIPPVIRAAMKSSDEGPDLFHRKTRMSNYVSCWTQGTRENMALWQLYGGISNSIAINTTVKKLAINCFDWNEFVHIKRVNYIDHSNVQNMIVGNYTDLLEFKHDAYEFEREVRLIIPRRKDWENNPVFIKMPVEDLNSVISSVLVSPEAEEWFFALIENINIKYELSCPLRRSSLSALP